MLRLLLILLLFPLSAFAAKESLDYTDTLHFTWAGIPLGELTITMKQKDNNYSMRAEGKTGGIVRLFNQHQSVTMVSGKIVKLAYIPKAYKSDYTDDDEKKLIALEYDKTGLPVKETIIPPREEIRPLVAEASKRGAVDILTGFFVMRDHVKKALATGKKEFAVKIYDGKRLFRVDAKLDKPRVNVTVRGVTRPAVKLLLHRVPLEGYKEKELKKLKDRNPWIGLFVEPERLVPFGLSLKVYGARLEAWALPKK